MTEKKNQPTAAGRLPGDLPANILIERMIRVDHAGEYGAKRIYEGQLAILRHSPSTPIISHMAEQEGEHLARFEKLMQERQVRPTALMPLWHVAGFALGATTALISETAAMACTAAVEEVIDDHYKEQAEALGAEEAELAREIEKFREEEIAHRDTALEAGAEDAPAHALLTTGIKAGTRLAIWLSERV